MSLSGPGTWVGLFAILFAMVTWWTGRQWRPHQRQPAASHVQTKTAMDAQANLAPEQLLDLYADQLRVESNPQRVFEAALRTLAKEPGHEKYLRFLKDIWPVAERTGAHKGQILQELANLVRNEVKVTSFRKQTLAGVQLTIRILTWLPYFVLGASVLFGVDVIAVFSTQPIVWASVVFGIVLTLAGRWWVHRMLQGLDDG